MSESLHQKALIKWWNNYGHFQFALPKLALFAIPNGGARTAITGANLKLEGVRKGVFDLRLESARNGFTGMYIEMKYGKNKLTPEQEDFEVMATLNGAKCVVCYDWEAAKREIENYLK
jgi:VRR-NUC domain